jgi:hypothetical protein
MVNRSNAVVDLDKADEKPEGGKEQTTCTSNEETALSGRAGLSLPQSD